MLRLSLILDAESGLRPNVKFKAYVIENIAGNLCQTFEAQWSAIAMLASNTAEY